MNTRKNNIIDIPTTNKYILVNSNDADYHIWFSSQNEIIIVTKDYNEITTTPDSLSYYLNYLQKQK